MVHRRRSTCSRTRRTRSRTPATSRAPSGGVAATTRCSSSTTGSPSIRRTAAGAAEVNAADVLLERVEACVARARRRPEHPRRRLLRRRRPVRRRRRAQRRRSAILGLSRRSPVGSPDCGDRTTDDDPDRVGPHGAVGRPRSSTRSGRDVERAGGRGQGPARGAAASPAGSGRSYGDPAQNGGGVVLRLHDHAHDVGASTTAAATATVPAGVSLDELLRVHRAPRLLRAGHAGHPLRHRRRRDRQRHPRQEPPRRRLVRQPRAAAVAAAGRRHGRRASARTERAGPVLGDGRRDGPHRRHPRRHDPAAADRDQPLRRRHRRGRPTSTRC